MKIKCRLNIILAEKNMSLRKLENKTKLNYTYLSKIKRNKTVPGVDNAIIIADALGRAVKEVWVFEESRK